MTLVPGRDYFRCDYCLSFQFPPGSGEDGVRLVGGASGLDCPVCRTGLQEGRIEGEPVQYCPHCRGFLATNPVFATIVRERRAKRPASESAYTYDPAELRRRIDCPKCRTRMDTHPFYGGGRVLIDTCPDCELIWLDAGELTVIEQHNPPRLVSDLPPTPALTSDAALDAALFDGDSWRIMPW